MEAEFTSLLLITFLAAVVPLVASRMRIVRLPIVVGEILAGVVIGKSGLDLVESTPALEFLADPDHPGFWRYPSFDTDGGAVQEEGLSIGDSMYVWFSTGRDGGTLTLARSDNDGQSFTILHDVSSNRFIGASVEPIPNLVIPGLEEVGETDWLFVFGIGPKYRQSDLFLAAVPLALIEDPQALLLDI